MIQKNKKNKLVTKVLMMPSCFVLLSSLPTLAADNPIAIAVHGGAGTISKAKMTPQRRAAYEKQLLAAVNKGYQLLEQGQSSQQAIIAAIQVLENSPLFNAGKGAVYTFEGHHELDASIMNGKTLNAGAVSGVTNVKNPILLAEQVMENSVHVMLSGSGAEKFAKHQGLNLVENNYFNTDARYKSLLKAKKKLAEKEAELKDFQAAHQTLPLEYKYGTVGAVAVDKSGTISAGTSTGGMTAKRYGRIGDAPIIGAGTYANNDSCAVSATGHGEYFIRYHVAADICARMAYQGKSLAEAADYVVNDVLVKAGGSGGVIAIDAQGNVATPFNSTGMYRAVKMQGQPAKAAIFKNE